ncbi:MAG: TonB-dependent receptor [Minicystis sp.]
MAPRHGQRWAFCSVFVAGLLLEAAAFAQGSGVLTGTVRDAATRRPLADVVVIVTSPALQGEQTVVTDATGQYRIPNLPPGPYTLRLDAEGHRPYARGDVSLRSATTVRVNADLLPEGLQVKEEAVVAAAPTVDIASSTTGVTLGSDFVGRIALVPPSAKGAVTRSFESLAEVAPGAFADRYGVSISGTTSPENQYVVDGLSVNNPAFGVIGTPLSIDFVKEVNVITGGYMPEFGRATGGYLDVVTKSGGNAFHGSAFASITPGALEGPRATIPNLGSSISTRYQLSSLRTFGAEIGGPIITDRLWFYAGVSPSFASTRMERSLDLLDTQNGVTTRTPIPGTRQDYSATQRAITYIGKLTWKVDSDNTVTLSVYGSPTYSGGSGTFGINPLDGTPELNNTYSKNIINGTYDSLAHYYVSSATDVSLKWQSAFDRKHLLLDVTLGWHHEEDAIRASDGTRLGSGQGLSAAPQIYWQRTTPHSINDFESYGAATAACDPAGTPAAVRCPVTTYYTGGPGFLPERILDRWQGKGVLTRLFTAAGGHHVAKAGADLEVMRFQAHHGYSGTNIYWETPDGTGFFDFRRYGFLNGPDKPVVLDKYDGTARSLTVGGFLQDSWSIADKVTLNLGVRYDAQLLYGTDGKLAMSLPHQWSPRIGVVYDFTQAGRSRLFANYARYYESVPLDMVERTSPGERFIASVHDAARCDPSRPSSASNPCDADASRYTVGAPFSPNQKWLTVSSDKAPVDPGIQPQSSDEFVIGGEYEVLPGARLGFTYTKRWQNRIIEDMSRDEAQSYFLGNPGYGIAKDFPRATRDYDAITFYFQKAFRDGWLSQASYTFSSLRGNWSGLFQPETAQLDPNLNSDFDLKSLLVNRTGPLPNDHTHQFKIFVARDFAFAGRGYVDPGVTFRALSGAPTSYYGSHPLYGPDNVFILPRGSGERLPWTFEVDAHVSLGVKLTKESSLELMMDVFNLFGFQGVTARDQTYTLASVQPIEGGTTADLARLKTSAGTPFDPKDKNPNFGNPIAYQPPRQFRFGAKVTF